MTKLAYQTIRRYEGMNDAYSQFLAWERTSSDNLLVKKTYVKIAGDLVAGACGGVVCK